MLFLWSYFLLDSLEKKLHETNPWGWLRERSGKKENPHHLEFSTQIYIPVPVCSERKNILTFLWKDQNCLLFSPNRYKCHEVETKIFKNSLAITCPWCSLIISQLCKYWIQSRMSWEDDCLFNFVTVSVSLIIWEPGNLGMADQKVSNSWVFFIWHMAPWLLPNNTVKHWWTNFIIMCYCYWDYFPVTSS